MFDLPKFDILAGDFSTGAGEVVGRSIRIKRTSGAGEMFDVADVTNFEIASEENYKKLSGRLGWGVAGALVFGPVGALAGLVLGGKSKDVNFIMVFDDGRKLLGKANEKAFAKIQVALFK